MSEHNIPIGPVRRRLPEVRASMTRRIELSGDLDIYVTIGFYEPIAEIEQPGEVFIKIAKEGSTIAGLVDSLAVLMSLMLQYGVPWDRIALKLRHTKFEPMNSEGKSIVHVIVTAIDEILSHRGSQPNQGYL